MSSSEIAVTPLIESRIWLIRGHKVLLDADLAALYELESKRLNEAVQRNRDRVPRRLYVSIDQPGNGGTFEMPNWHLK